MTSLPQKIVGTSSEVIKKMDELQEGIARTEKAIDSKIEPVRKGFVKRFPVLFMLLVALGVTATFF